MEKQHEAIVLGGGRYGMTMVNQMPKLLLLTESDFNLNFKLKSGKNLISTTIIHFCFKILFLKCLYFVRNKKEILKVHSTSRRSNEFKYQHEPFFCPYHHSLVSLFSSLFNHSLFMHQRLMLSMLIFLSIYIH